jgi:hypothetical protein
MPATSLKIAVRIAFLYLFSEHLIQILYIEISQGTIRREKKGLERRRAFECSAGRDISFELEFVCVWHGLAVLGVA